MSKYGKIISVSDNQLITDSISDYKVIIKKYFTKSFIILKYYITNTLKTQNI